MRLKVKFDGWTDEDDELIAYPTYRIQPYSTAVLQAVRRELKLAPEVPIKQKQGRSAAKTQRKIPARKRKRKQKQDVFYVESIVAARFVEGNHRQFLVKWKGIAPERLWALFVALVFTVMWGCTICFALAFN